MTRSTFVFAICLAFLFASGCSGKYPSRQEAKMECKKEAEQNARQIGDTSISGDCRDEWQTRQFLYYETEKTKQGYKYYEKTSIKKRFAY